MDERHGASTDNERSQPVALMPRNEGESHVATAAVAVAAALIPRNKGGTQAAMAAAAAAALMPRNEGGPQAATAVAPTAHSFAASPSPLAMSGGLQQLARPQVLSSQPATVLQSAPYMPRNDPSNHTPVPSYSLPLTNPLASSTVPAPSRPLALPFQALSSAPTPLIPSAQTQPKLSGALNLIMQRKQVQQLQQDQQVQQLKQVQQQVQQLLKQLNLQNPEQQQQLEQVQQQLEQVLSLIHI